MKTSLFITLLVSSFSIAAQTPNGQKTFDPEQNLRTLGNLSPLSVGAIGFDDRYSGIKGTPLLFTTWQWGTIQFAKNDTMSAPFKMNIDLVKNTLIVQLRNGSLGEITAVNVKKVQFKSEADDTSQLLVASEKAVEGKNSVRLKFYEVFYDGTMRLLKSTDKQFKKADYKGAYNSGNTYDEFLTEENYWLSVDGKRFEKVKIRRKEIETVLAAHAERITELSKSNKLNLNELQDVVQLLGLLESDGKN
jgi:hypothetical protein